MSPARTEESGTLAGSQRKKIAVARITETHTTALYFERAAKEAGHEVITVNDPQTRLKSLGCDLLIVVDPWFHGLDELPELACPTVAILIDVHRGLETRATFARYFDHGFVVQRDFVEAVAKGSHDSMHWLPLAGDPKLHFIPDQERDLEVGFVGKMGTPGSARHDLLSRVLARFKTNDTSSKETLTMGPVYSRSKIVINRSIDGDLNMRVFEAMAAGALLVTDRIGNGLSEIAKEGVHYVGYDTVDEALEKIEHYLSDDAAREQIALAGQEHLRAHHSYDARFAQMMDVVDAAGETRGAPARAASPLERTRLRAHWGRHRGITALDAAKLVARGLPPTDYSHLAIGILRNARKRRARKARR
ncbi:MAG: glycosyltransferase [Pseudomonadota bacterium]